MLSEEVTVRYGDELDVFVEKRFGTNFSVRLSANNLLDASKDEFFHKFDNMDDQIDRDYDEYETGNRAGRPVLPDGRALGVLTPERETSGLIGFEAEEAGASRRFFH